MTGVQVADDVGQVGHEWIELGRRVDAVPWLRAEWVRAWWGAFGRGRLEIIAVRRDGRLVAVLPLQRRRDELRSTSNYHTPRFGVLDDGSGGSEAARALFERPARRISLAFLDPEEAETYRQQANASGRPVLSRVLERSPCVVTEQNWEEYQRRLRTKLLRELARRRRRLESRAPLSLVVEDGGRDLDGLLEEGFGVEAAAWKGARGTGIASTPATHRFYRQVARWAASQGWLRLAFLRSGSEAVAFDYSIEHRRVHYLLKTGYDPRYRVFAPGMLMRQAMLARAFSLRLSRYEFLGRDEPWKLEWAVDFRDRMLVQAFSRTPVGYLDWAAFAYGRPIAKALIGRFRR